MSPGDGPAASIGSTSGATISVAVARLFHPAYRQWRMGDCQRHLVVSADEVRVVFNNNSCDYAPKAAEQLRRKFGQISGRRQTPQQDYLL